MDNIGDKIRIQRLMKGYSQEYMGFLLEISQAAYSKIERNETELSLRRIYEIAEILKISPFELMPKPKYGTGINPLYISKTLYKLKKFWLSAIKRKMAATPPGYGFHSDISNRQTI
ncbi:MAG: helix-turn-helix domain-containing protein [Sphingobacteriales bacterium]